jgi:glycosyltransferase involved in cell wall biosynthesis
MTGPGTDRPLRVLFFVEGFTDIRFVTGLSEVCELTLAVPERTYGPSGLRQRVANSGAKLTVREIPGGRLGFQFRSLGYLLRHAGEFDVILAQEVTRGALNANVAGRLAGVPVVNTLAMPPVEYYRCRWERRTIGRWRYHTGDAVIRALMAVNGRLATTWVALGPYLRGVARRHTPRVGSWAYYGVDTAAFRPATPAERHDLRARHGLPAGCFLILLASRVSHEKDPETALLATHLARERGLRAVLLNLGGGYREFLELARRLSLPDPESWVMGRPAAHPMLELPDYFRAADVLVQASLEEGLGLSPLEALACGTPVVATAVGGMAVQLAGHARLTPRRDPEAMAEEFLWIAAHPEEAGAQALRARETNVIPEWNRAKAFQDLESTLRRAVRAAPAPPPAAPGRTRPRRLLSIAHSYVVGMNRRLAHEMARVGGNSWEVTAVAPTLFHGSNDLRTVRLEPEGSESCRLVAVNAYLTSRVHVFLYGRRLRSLLAEGWDVVHCWEEPYILAGGQVAWWTPAKAALVFRTAQSISKTYPPPFRWVERYAMTKAAGWICSGSLVANALRDRPGYDKPMVRIPLGVDVESFRPDAAAGREILAKLGWRPGTPVIGYLGRFVADKGLGLLTRTLDHLSGDWRAMFVGAGPLEPELRKWAEGHGDRVRLCTDVTHDRVPAYLNAMTVLCAPSQTMPNWKEQFGRMVVEAFASGLPFIGSDSGEIPFVVGDAGLVVGEKDVDGWTRAIAGLLADPARRRELAERGLQRARDEFAWPAVARQYLNFFERVLPAGR